MKPKNLGTANPFDVRPDVGWSVSVLLGPTLLAEASDGTIRLLQELAEYDFTSVVGVATDAPLRARIEAAGIRCGWLELEGDSIVLRTQTSVASVGREDTRKWLLGQSNSERAAAEHLLALSHLKYDFVVGGREGLRAAPPPYTNLPYIDLVALLTAIRLLCVKHHRYEIYPRHSVNEGFYYLYRKDRLFPEFRRAWLYGRSLNERRMSGLWKRLAFTCRTADLAAIEARRTPNNDAEDNFLFYSSYQYMLSTGAFDDLAALCSSIYDLRLPRMKTTLKISKNGRSLLRDSVAAKNMAVAEFLGQPRTTDLIESFYPIRDALQHREFPYTVAQSTGPRWFLSSVVVLPREGIDLLRRGLGVDTAPVHDWPSDPDNIRVELWWLVASATKALSLIVNGLLASIPWRDLTRSPDGVHPSDEAWASFTKGPGHFLGWGVEPLLFRW